MNERSVTLTYHAKFSFVKTNKRAGQGEKYLVDVVVT